MEKKELIVYTVEQLIGEGNIEVIKTVFSEDYIAHAGNKQYHGHNFLKRWTKQVHSAIKGLEVEKVLFLSQDQQIITWQRTLTGIHKKGLKGIPATDKKVTWTEMVVSRFEDNKIIEEWVVSEMAGELLLKQPKN